MNRFWGLKLAAMQKTVDAMAQQPAQTATPVTTAVQADVIPDKKPGTIAAAPARVAPVDPPNWKSAEMFTNEGRETLGEILGGLGGLATGTTVLEGLGQMVSPFKQHGGYSPTMLKLLKGEQIGGVGKGLPARLALALLMGLPYAASMTGGQSVGSHLARKYNAEAQAQPTYGV